MILTIINPPANLWDNYLDTAFDALTVFGYDVYAETGDLENKSKWIYVIFDNGVSQTIDIPVGYEKHFSVKPNAGFSDINTILDLARSDSGLAALFTSLGLDGNNITFEDLDGLDLESIDPNDFTLKKSSDGRVITNIAAQPYEVLQDSLLSGLKDSNSSTLYAIKDF